MVPHLSIFAANVELVRIIPWPSASSIIGMFASSLATACCMSGLEKSTPVSTTAIVTSFPVTLYNSCTRSEFARFPISEIFEWGSWLMYLEWKSNGKSSIMWKPADSRCAMFFSGSVTIEKNPLEDETEFEIPFVKKSISVTDPCPNTIYRFELSSLSNWLIVMMSEVSWILSKLNESEFFSIMSPPKYANDSLAIIGTDSKNNKSGTNLFMITNLF